MTAMRGELPDGYAHQRIGRTELVVRVDAMEPIARVLAAAAPSDEAPLAAWAARQPARRELQGRGAVHAVALPDGRRVVVRHVRHGGLLAGLTGDRFALPTRAPAELRAAVRLAAAGVPTPTVVAYALYPAGPLLRRVDVVTDEIVGGLDLPAALAAWPAHAAALLDATAALLVLLADAGARHPDLNVKNVLLIPPAPPRPAVAHVLDVDRVRFGGGRDAVLRANAGRLLRSARKQRAAGRLALADAQLAPVVRLAAGAAGAAGAAA